MRRVDLAGVFAAVIKRGDPDAGAIAVKVFRDRDHVDLYTEARDADGNHVWIRQFEEPVSEADVEAKIAGETKFDSDLWVIEIEDREGRSFLEDEC